MNTTLNHSAQVYSLKIDNENVGFCAIIHFPHPKNKKIKKVHRLVILPDYQGIGIGVKFLEFVGDVYKNDNFTFNIVTSAKNLIYALKNNKSWCLTFFGRQNNSSKTSTSHCKAVSMDRNTYSFSYKGKK